MSEKEIRSCEVSWKVLGIEAFGTITEPVDDRTHAGVVFVAGSGPTDRDWCSSLLPGTNGSAKLLAEALAREGYVTLRYDKLASGPHVTENLPKFAGKLSMKSHAEELAGAVNALVSHGTVEKKNLFALTNSEGAIHAVNYQLLVNGPKFKGMILTGAPGRAIGSVGRDQLSAQVKSAPNAEKNLMAYDEAISRFLRGEATAPDDYLPESLKGMLKALETPANLPFSRELWTYDLSDHIADVTEPILVLIGKKDIQIDWREDGEKLKKALLMHQDATFSYPGNANHVLKFEALPRDKLTVDYVGTHYNASEAELDKEATGLILSWLKRHL